MREAETNQIAEGYCDGVSGRRGRGAHVDGEPEFNKATATFGDSNQEAAYRRHLAKDTLPRARRIWLLMSFVFFSYGLLDLLTIKDHLAAILAVRWGLLTPIALAIYALTFVERVKPWSGSLFAFGVLASALGVIWMISVIPAQGSPPYVIGILVVFIFSSCNVQMPFSSATAAYFLSAAAYCALLLSSEKFTRTDVISGYFFMISSAGVAILTNYVQEIRLRMIWIHNERRRADAKSIQDLMIEATASDQSKINFLSILSHELRTPLHQIIGFSEVLQAPTIPQTPEDHSKYLTEINKSAHRLLTSIAKMLRYADATAGKISYSLDVYRMMEVVEVATDQFATRAESREVSIDTSGLMNGSVQVDQASVSYAIGCLIDNAINASRPTGRIIVAGEPTTSGGYVLRITDHGAGMTPEEVKRAFDPFSQLGNVRTRSGEGLGIGLSLANKILGDQGATLIIESEPRMGTTASVIFPPPNAKAASA